MKAAAVFPNVFDRLFFSGSSADPYAVGISLESYRQHVLRDLRWLLNAKCHPRASSIHAYRRVASSTLNYGMQDLLGTFDSRIEPEDIIQSVKTAILRYEPRIIPSTLSVSLPVTHQEFHIDAFGLEIHGDLWALPVNEPMTLRSIWDGIASRWRVE